VIEATSALALGLLASAAVSNAAQAALALEDSQSSSARPRDSS
jgi:hypothetical protein